MSDPGIFIFGCGVFGLTLAATVASIIGTSQPIDDELDVPDEDADDDETIHEFTNTASGGPVNDRRAG